MAANNHHAGDERVELVRQILWLSRKHFQLSTALLEETGLGSGQVPVLMELERHGELNQRELAEKTRVTPATMSGTLKRMEKAGFIQRTADENDARISRVRLTEAGHAQCENARRGFDSACHKILAGLDDDSLALLKALLTRIQDNLGGMNCCRSESTKKE